MYVWPICKGNGCVVIKAASEASELHGLGRGIRVGTEPNNDTTCPSSSNADEEEWNADHQLVIMT
eukprot:scaffold353783_cov45-Prasinocladus_malaysianus.AAC.1